MLALPSLAVLLENLSQELDKNPSFDKLCKKMNAAQNERHCDVEFANPNIKNNKYNVKLDFRKFKPEEVEIKLGGDKMLQISGKHEQMSEDGSSYVYRQYIHHFSVPDNVEHEKLTSKLDNSGVLIVEAPVKNSTVNEDGSRTIPIEFVNKN